MPGNDGATVPQQERLGHSTASPAPTIVGLAIHPMVQRSQEAFRRDLPQLLQTKKLYRQWVLYQGDQRLAIATSEDALYRECARRGLKDHEFVVRCIVPEVPPDLDITPLHDV